MHHHLITRLVPLLAQYGYIILFPIAVVEGPAAAMVAGALVASGDLNGLYVTLLLVVADLIGDAGYYSLGRWGHTPLLEQIGKRLSVTHERLRPLEERFRKHDWQLILIGKTQALGSVILYFAGAIRMSFARFMAWNSVATVPKVLLFEMVGYFLGRSILHSQRRVDEVTAGAFTMALLLLVLYWLSRKYLEKKVTDSIST